MKYLEINIRIFKPSIKILREPSLNRGRSSHQVEVLEVGAEHPWYSHFKTTLSSSGFHLILGNEV